MTTGSLPSALARFGEIRSAVGGRRPVVFLDYDGTLTPIVERPELARLSEPMRETVRELARRVPVAVISGRDLGDVRGLVAIDGIFYAGSHGFEIDAPSGARAVLGGGEEFLDSLDIAERELAERTRGIEGVLVERKRFSIAVHYRMARERDLASIHRLVSESAARHPRLRRSEGKKVHELRPGVEWHKGKAVLALLARMAPRAGEAAAVYIGDDLTDEDAFHALRGRGVGIVVRDADRPTAAGYALEDVAEVGRFLTLLAAACRQLPAT